MPSSSTPRAPLPPEEQPVLTQPACSPPGRGLHLPRHSSGTATRARRSCEMAAGAAGGRQREEKSRGAAPASGPRRQHLTSRWRNPVLPPPKMAAAHTPVASRCPSSRRSMAWRLIVRARELGGRSGPAVSMVRRRGARRAAGGRGGSRDPAQRGGGSARRGAFAA